MSNLQCPYCDYELEDPDDAYQEDRTYQECCPDCKMNFTFTLCYRVHYSSYEAPCLNGSPHEFKPISGSPHEYYKNRMRCIHCEKEVTTVPEEPKP